MISFANSARVLKHVTAPSGHLLSPTPVFYNCFKSFLIFIAAAVNQSYICTFHLLMNRVRLSPCTSLAKAKTTYARTFRCLSSSCPIGSDNLSFASSTNFWSKRRLMVRSSPEDVHRSLNWQTAQVPSISTFCHPYHPL